MKQMKQIFAALIFVLAGQPTSYAASGKPPHTVLDYYNRLPERYFESPEIRSKWIKHAGNVIDIKNGYLYLQGDGAQPSLYVTLFKTADKSYVIGVYAHGSDDNALDFYRYNGRWRDVSKRVLPARIDKAFLERPAKHDDLNDNYEYTIEMPRRGTTIVIRNSRGQKAYELRWTRHVFKLKKR